MRKNFYLAMTVVSALAFTSCKKLGALSADNFTVTPTSIGERSRSSTSNYQWTVPREVHEEKSSGNCYSCFEVRRR